MNRKSTNFGIRRRLSRVCSTHLPPGSRNNIKWVGFTASYQNYSSSYNIYSGTGFRSRKKIWGSRVLSSALVSTATLLHAGDLLGFRVLNNRCEIFSRFIGKVGPQAGEGGAR